MVCQHLSSIVRNLEEVALSGRAGHPGWVPNKTFLLQVLRCLAFYASINMQQHLVFTPKSNG